jgi:hypothetical protein
LDQGFWDQFLQFTINVDIAARDNHPFVAIMAFPNPPEATGSDDQINMRVPFHVGAKGMNDNEHALDVFSVHGLFIPSTVLFFNQMEHECTQYSLALT